MIIFNSHTVYLINKIIINAKNHIISHHMLIYKIKLIIIYYNYNKN
jgi:hypothetical protein